jgi:hypothetical protein
MISHRSIGGNVIVHGATPDWVGVVANTIRDNVIRLVDKLGRAVRTAPQEDATS